MDSKVRKVQDCDAAMLRRCAQKKTGTKLRLLYIAAMRREMVADLGGSRFVRLSGSGSNAISQVEPLDCGRRLDRRENEFSVLFDDTFWQLLSL